SPDLPPHPAVIKVLQEESAKPGNHAYQSYKGSPVLRNAIAEWYKQWYQVSLNANTEILPLIGSKEGIMHICMTYLNEGDFALIPDPGYPTYGAAVKLAGAQPVNYDLAAGQYWTPDLDVLESEVKELNGRGAGSVKLMFVNYPHMPTGQLPDRELLTKLVRFAKANELLLIHDNPYSFILNENPASILAIEGAREVAMELNSLSKSHNMAGWRVGMLLASADRINEVLKFKSNMDSGMFLPVQLAAAAALRLDKAWYLSVNETYRKRQTKVFALLDLLKCHYNPQQAGMFVWAAIPEGVTDGYALSDELLYKADVFITPGGIFGKNGNGYVRISLCCPEEKIEQAINRIKDKI
ncbi:MAG: aminotransferase class I/II-fold pyridoxal phosphate-dependent enzyme, partial [Sphingobacteriales bacterium]